MKKVKLAALFITEFQEFQLLQAEDAKATAARLNAEIDIVFANGEPVTQIRQLFHYTGLPEKDRPGAIIVEAISADGYERAARAAVDAGIGWVLLNSHFQYIEELRGQRPDLPIFSVTNDQTAIGSLQARQFRAILPAGGTLLYVQGPSRSSASTGRLSAMQEGIQDSGIGVQLVRGDWTEEGGEKAVLDWLRRRSSLSDPPQIVGCQNDSMAVGARRAVQSTHPEWKSVAFTGVDGLPKGGQSMVDSGRLIATVITPSSSGPAVDLANRCLSRNEPTPSSVSLEPKPYPAIEALSPRAR